MQGKGVVKFFAILLAVVCLYQLSFTWVTHKVKDDAHAYAKGDTTKEKAYLDSILSSGDGKTGKTAFVVATVDEEYFYLNLVMGRAAVDFRWLIFLMWWSVLFAGVFGEKRVQRVVFLW